MLCASGFTCEEGRAVERDRNECFVLRRCIAYMERYLRRYFTVDGETMTMLCWVLGEDTHLVFRHLLSRFDKDSREEFEEELSEDYTDIDEYADLLTRMMLRARRSRLPLRPFVFSLLTRRYKRLSYRGSSDIEKNVAAIAKVFRLDDAETAFCVLFLIADNYDAAESFFVDHLDCDKLAGRKNLKIILDLNSQILGRIIEGTLQRSGLIELDGACIEFSKDARSWLMNPSGQVLSEFYARIDKKAIPLSYHFAQRDGIDHILKLLSRESATSTHILLYGPPGTGKSSCAHGLANSLGLDAYEIIRGEENTSEERRTAIIACLNMTNSDQGSLILVDEADNILNTRFSWFMRGETQDKGWLNELLEEPGVRMVWVVNSIENIEDSVLRRFAFSLHFKPFSRRQRIQLWDQVLRRNRCKRMLRPPEIERFARQYSVSAGAIDLAVKKALEASPESRDAFRRSLALCLDAHVTMMNDGEKPVRKDRIEESYSTEGLNLDTDPAEVITLLARFDESLRGADQSRILNMNILLHGPPGTGKSELARHIAAQISREIMVRRVSDLHDKYLGESEKNIKRAFAEAEAEEAVLVIDEADSLLFSRDRAERSWEISFTNEFLTQMERFRGILICTTNRLKDLDEASIRRFNHKIGFDYLTAQGNVVFYKRLLSDLPAGAPDPAILPELKTIDHLTPGDFKVVRDRYAFYAKGEVDHPMLVNALKEEARIKRDHQGKTAIGF